MFNSQTLDELTRKISQTVRESPAKDMERSLKALLQSSLQRLKVVPREEFEIQAQVLARTREKLEAARATAGDRR